MSSNGKPYLEIILVSIASALLSFGLAIDTNFGNILEAARYGLIGFASALAAGLRPGTSASKGQGRRKTNGQRPKGDDIAPD